MKSQGELTEQVFAEASEIPDGEARKRFLDEACADQPQLREDVESLLAALDGADSFMEKPHEPITHHPLKPGGSPRVFGEYELLEEIARGGMGVVYKARQTRLNRMVAIKMILTGRLASDSEVRRFHSEAEAAGSLNHPNIVSIYEVGEQEGYHYYSMPLLEGMSLSQWVESGQWEPGDGTEAAMIVAKLAEAVEHAHRQGILHRDLKPGNILLDGQGEPHILDFGLAKRIFGESNLTLSGDVLGTPSFMAPEQAAGKGKATTEAADIYNLGAILYYLLTGKPPFVADSALDAMLLVLEGEAVLPRSVNPRISSDLERICLCCLSKSPEDRYPSAQELSDDLQRFLKNEPLAQQSKAMGRRLSAWAKHQPALVSRLAGISICAIISETAYRLNISNMHPIAQFHEVAVNVQHYRIIAVLAIWALISWICQWALLRERWPETTRYVWAGVDAATLTAILFIDQAVQSPLIAFYPVWVAGSALWMRVPLVLFTLGMALAGYVFLLVDAIHHRAVWLFPFHWHGVILALLVLTGVIAAYLVHRVRVLSRFYDKRAQA